MFSAKHCYLSLIVSTEMSEITYIYIFNTHSID